MKDSFITKICGIRNDRSFDAVIAHLKRRPKMIGLMFITDSKRFVDDATAHHLAGRAHQHGILAVGVFRNHPVEEVNRRVTSTPLDYVQLHGTEDPGYCRQVAAPVIKSITLQDTTQETARSMDTYEDTVAFFLLDRPIQGEGEVVNPQQVGDLSQQYPIILAGGLNPDNITDAITKSGSALKGVDVSSGVERIPGEKDKRLVKTFLGKIRRTYE